MSLAPGFKASDYQDGKRHLLLAASGSVATIKIPNILKALSRHKNLSVRVILTESASEFLKGQSEEQPSLEEIANTPNLEGIYRDADEWAIPWVRGNPILHIELRRWADLLVIAPLSADALAKIINGFSDSLLTSVVRAWDGAGRIDGKEKKIFVAPAMNTAMWLNPITVKQITILESEEMGGWFRVLFPADKSLACGDIGSGAMKEWSQIVEDVEEHLDLTTTE